jgi:ABC-type Fe3+ transport system substrate-binding protein
MANDALKPRARFVHFCIGLVATVLTPSIVRADPSAHTKKLIEGAKVEGKAVWYTTINVGKSRPILDRFEKKYPFIKGEIVRAGGGPLLNRISREARAGKQLFDVVNGGAEISILKRTGVITTYASPERGNLENDLRDSEGFWTGLYGQAFVLGYNTKLVQKADLPRDYNGLLEPQWKGKLLSDADDVKWFSGLLHAWGREKGLAYMRKLAKQDQAFVRGSTARTQLVAAGERPLLIAYNHVLEFNKSKGAPIDWIPLEPVIFSPAIIMYAKGGSHPNAGKLLIDFLLSKEGQEVFRDFNAVPAHKNVDPVPPRLAMKGYRRFVLAPEMYDDYAEVEKLYREIFNVN